MDVRRADCTLLSTSVKHGSTGGANIGSTCEQSGKKMTFADEMNGTAICAPCQKPLGLLLLQPCSPFTLSLSLSLSLGDLADFY